MTADENLLEQFIGACSEEHHIDKVRRMLEAGVPVNGLFKGETGLHRAVGNRCPKVTYLLLQHGADPGIKTKYDQTVLESAEHHEVLVAMLKAAEEGQLLSPFETLDLDMLKNRFLKLAAGLRELAKVCGQEKVYAMALDAGELKLNTEEAFEHTLKSYRGEDDRFLPEKLTARDLTPEQQELAKIYIDSIDGYDSVEDCLGMFEQQNQAQNQQIRKNNEERSKDPDNPYRLGDEKQIAELRMNVGDWSYQVKQADPLVESEFTFEAMKQKEDDDRMAADVLVDLIKENRDVLLSGYRLAGDLKVFAAAHRY